MSVSPAHAGDDALGAVAVWRVLVCEVCGEAESMLECECCGAQLCLPCWGDGDSFCAGCTGEGLDGRPVEDVQLGDGYL